MKKPTAKQKKEDEPSIRAEMVIEGSHPTIYYANVIEAYGLDDSFVWTPAKLSPYVELYRQEYME